MSEVSTNRTTLRPDQLRTPNVNNTEYWEEHSLYVPKKGEIIVYTDGASYDDSGTTVYVEKIKVGDGVTTVANLGFTDDEKADIDDLSSVAFSGNYNDLSNKPTIPAAQVQSDYEQTDSTAIDYIKNAPLVRIYRELTGTAAVTSSPYSHSKYDVTDSSVTSYVDGMVVCLKVPVAGHGTYGTALQINSLGYKPIVYNVNSMIGTRYSVGSVVWAVYNSTQTASLYNNSSSASTVTGCWQVMDYDANTTSISNLIRYNGTRVVTADLLRYVIAFRKDETTIVPIHSVAGTGTSANSAVTATTKTMTTESFDPFGEIYYYATNTKITTGNPVALSALYTQKTGVDARYIFNCAKTLTSNKELFLVVDLQSDKSVKLAAIPWAQALPTTNDGHLYILLGYTYSTYQFELYYYHPIYYYDGKLRMYSGDKIPTATSQITNDSGYITASDVTTVNTTSYWQSHATYVPRNGEIIVYSDGETIEVSGQTVNVPKVKIGTGNEYVGQLPFVGQPTAEKLDAHIADTVKHITSAERALWNGKLNISTSQAEHFVNETLIFNRN